MAERAAESAGGRGSVQALCHVDFSALSPCCIIRNLSDLCLGLPSTEPPKSFEFPSDRVSW